MSALSDAVKKHHQKITDEALASIQAAFPAVSEDRALAFVETSLSGVLARIRKSGDPTLVDALSAEVQAGHLSAFQASTALIRVTTAMRMVLFVDVSSRRVASVASRAIDRAVSDAIEELGEIHPSAAPSLDNTFGGATADLPIKEPTIIRNINEILGDAPDAEPKVCTVLAVHLKAPEKPATVRSACIAVLSESDATPVAEMGDIIAVSFEEDVGQEDVKAAMDLALTLCQAPLLAGCSVGLSRGSIVFPPVLDDTAPQATRPATGPAVERAIALATLGESGFVRCDTTINDIASADYVLRPRRIVDQTFRLDPYQPQWLDRWEHASFVVDPPFVGRTDLKRELRAILRAPTGKGSVVGLKGPSGVGRLELLHTSAKEAGIPTARILIGQPHPLTPAPYWPLISIARQLLHLEDGALVAQTLRDRISELATSSATTSQLFALEPTLGTLLGVEDADEATIEEMDPQAMRSEIARSMRLLLQAAADREPEHPLLLIIRDAHRLDAPTLHSLNHVLRTYDGTAPLILALSYRGSFKPTPTFEKAGFKELILERLESEDLVSIAREMLEQYELPKDLLTLLKKRTDGLPLMAATLIRFLVEAGYLQRREGQWVVDGELPAIKDVPRHLSRLLTHRINNLPEQLAGMLKSAAAVGETLPESTLELVWVHRGIASDDIRRSTGLLIELGFLERDPDAGLRFSHPLVREVAYKMQSDRELREVHGLVAVAYRERYPDAINQLPAVLFFHSSEAGDQEFAREAAVSGARRAMLLQDHKRATALATEGIRLCDDESKESREARFELRSVLERVHDNRNSRSEQAKDLDILLNLADELGGGHRQGNILHRSARFHLLTGDIERATKDAEKSVTRLADGDPLDLSNALRTVALVRWHARDANGAAKALTEALAIYEKLNHQRGMGVVLHTLGLFALDTGALPQARAYFEQALRLKEGAHDAEGMALVLDSLGQVALLEGKNEEAAAALQQAVDERLGAGNRSAAALSQVNLGEALLPTDPVRAEELARAAIRHGRGKKNLRTNIEANILLARALLYQDKRQPAGRPASLAVKRAKELGSRLLILRGQLAQAEVDLAYTTRQRTERALYQAEAAAETAEKAGAHRWHIEALSLVAAAYAKLESKRGKDPAERALALLGERKHPGLDVPRIEERCTAALDV